MAEGDEKPQLKFRISDGTDIGREYYSPSTKIATLKQQLLSGWPQGPQDKVPKSVSDMKIIHAGKVLENEKTLADYGVKIGDISSEVITMHVVVQPPVVNKKIGKNQSDEEKQGSCSCSIL